MEIIVVNEVMNIEYLQHIIQQYFEDHLLLLHDNIKNVLAQKNSTIEVLITEKERLAQTNEILGEQIRRSYVEKDTPDASGHEYAEKLHNINIKKKIIDDENARLKSELMTLKHEKMRDEKLNSDKMSKLNREIKKLRDDVEHKTPVEEGMSLKTISDQFITYKSQMEIVMDSLNKSLLDKEEEIKRLNKQLMDEVSNQPSDKKSDTNMHKDLLDALKLNKTVFVKKISELSADSEAIMNKMRDEESMITNIHVRANMGQESVEIKKINEAKENIVVVSNDGSRTDNDGDDVEIVLGIQSNSNMDESMTSTKLYDKSKAREVVAQPLPFYEENRHRCPIPKCWKAFKKVSQVKGHVVFHWFKLVSSNFPFKKDQQCTLCVTKTILKTLSGHVYHYGVTHKQLMNLIPDSDENKQYAKQFLK